MNEQSQFGKLNQRFSSISQVVNRCIQCGICGPSCPASSIMNFTLRQAVITVGTQGNGRILSTDAMDHLTNQIEEGAWYCFDCGYCEERCPEDMTIPKLMSEVREVARTDGFLPDSAKMMNANIKQHHNPYGSYAQRKRNDWSSKFDLPHKSETMLFFGCTPAYRDESILTSTIKVLKSVEVGILEDEWCCGYPTKVMGYSETARKMARHNVEALKDAGAERIITVCPSCYRTLKEEYPDMLGNMPFEVLHVTEYLQELPQQDLPFQTLDKKVTYQDSCHLGRHMKVYESPRAVLRRIPGLELVEMDRNRWRAKCCGGGGGVKSIEPELSREQGIELLKQAKRKDIEELVTACPFCKSNLTDSAKRADMEMNITYITELLTQSMPSNGGKRNE